MKLGLVSLLALPSMLLAQQTSTTSVPVQNDAVTVMHLILPPGQRTQYHTHTHDRIAVTLSATSTNGL